MSEIKKYFDLEFYLWLNFGVLKRISSNIVYIDNNDENKDEFYFQGMINTTFDSFDYNNDDISMIDKCSKNTANVFKIPYHEDDIRIAESDVQWDYYASANIITDKFLFEDLRIVETRDIVQFSKILAVGFNLPKTFSENFSKRLQAVSNSIESRFFFIEKNNSQIGCCSYHRNFNDEQYCLMNVTIHKGCRGNDYSRYLITESLIQINNPKIYSRTNNVNMKKIFSKVGLKKVGSIYVSERKI
jgi:hypothetical protein